MWYCTVISALLGGLPSAVNRVSVAAGPSLFCSYMVLALFMGDGEGSGGEAEGETGGETVGRPQWVNRRWGILLIVGRLKVDSVPFLASSSPTTLMSSSLIPPILPCSRHALRRPEDDIIGLAIAGLLPLYNTIPVTEASITAAGGRFPGKEVTSDAKKLAGCWSYQSAQYMRPSFLYKGVCLLLSSTP